MITVCGGFAFGGVVAIKVPFGHIFSMTLGSFGNQGVCDQGREVIPLAIAVDQLKGLGLKFGEGTGLMGID